VGNGTGLSLETPDLSDRGGINSQSSPRVVVANEFGKVRRQEGRLLLTPAGRR
jgi:hypothetical protein